MGQNTMNGYHGTSLSQANSILKTGFRDSCGDDEWLGKGAYFFAHKSHAIIWATTHLNSKYKSQPSVVCAQLIYNDEQILDIDNPDHHKFLFDFVRYTQEKSKNSIFADLSNLSHKKQWCLICNVFKEMYPGIGIIVYTFPYNPKDSSYNNTVFSQRQRQICVNNHAIINNPVKEAM